MRVFVAYLFALLLTFEGKGMVLNPNELYDNLYEGFEKSMPIPLVVCSDYASSGDFVNAANELYNFNKAFRDFFSSDFTKNDSKESIAKSLKVYCESIRNDYKVGKQYNPTYPAKDFVWYSLCGRLYFAYEGMISQIVYSCESISKINTTIAAKKYILPIVKLLYEKVDHGVYQTFSDFCSQMLPCLMN